MPSNSARSSVDIETSPDSSVANIKESLQSPVNHDESSSAAAVVPRRSHDSGISSRNSKEIFPSDASDLATRNIVEDTQDNAEREIEAPKILEGDGPGTSDAPREIPPVTTESPAETIPAPLDGDKATIAQLQAEHKAAESRWQEEMHGYIERIDALQSKLKYLAKEAAESAKKAAATAEPGSVERQLREKDEKIALLLEEGQKLSKTELDHRTAIKKLRQQLAENAKVQDEAKRRTDKLERDLASSEARAKRAEAAEKRANSSLASQTKVARDLETVTAERDALSQTVEEMKKQLASAVSRAEAAESKAQSDALEQEKRRASQLEEELTNMKIEREIAEEKFKRQITGLKESVGQEKERARLLEVELKGEQSVLESKMESLRSRAEEASSGVTGDAQAKLLRQIETLQTQYAVASENWQALEGSLLSRLANVERERDDLARREGDMRRKIREVVSGIVDLLLCKAHWANCSVLVEPQGEEGRRGA